jgi:EAL domain-containing protein (putative c-di-GMP-specific phosphodiesterase class I)
VLKIDRSFIGGSIDNQVDASLVKAVVQIGYSLGLELVGEGIETQQHFDYLKKIGCHYGQGYHMSRPLPVNDFINFVEQAHTFNSNITA